MTDATPGPGQPDLTIPPPPGVPPTVPYPPVQQQWGAAGPAGGARKVGKVRSPWGAWALSLITFGIYYLYWYYKVNDEVHEYDSRIDVQPGLALLALFVPIANIVSMVKTGGRIKQAQQSSGIGASCSGGVGFLLAILFSTHIVYYQSSLNKIWEAHGNQAPGTQV